MSERIVWDNLQLSDFIHPSEVEVKQNEKLMKGVESVVHAVSEVELKIHATQIKGEYVQLNEHTAPHLFSILKDVCHILNYKDRNLDVFVFRSMVATVQPFRSDKSIFLLFSDYVLQYFDDEMLYYMIGNAISMIIAGHVDMSTAASYMKKGTLFTLPAQLAFKKYLHIADATSDRGGLLACQSLAAVARCQFLEFGMPISVTQKMFTNNEKTANYIDKYLSDVYPNTQNQTLLEKISNWNHDLVCMERAALTMLSEIYYWYNRGYKKLREEYLRRQNK